MLRKKIVVLGLGTGAGRIVAQMNAVSGTPPVLAVLDTDLREQDSLDVPVIIKAGDGVTDGEGAAGDIERGCQAVEQESNVLRELVAGKDLLFLVVCLGGGTGSGGAQSVLRIAQEEGVDTLCMAFMPFSFEGPGRRTKANLVVPLLLEKSAAVLVLPNDRLFASVGTPQLDEAFNRAGRIAAEMVAALCRMIASPAYIRLEYSQFLRILSDSKRQFNIGYGSGAGPQREQQALANLWESPLLERGHVLERARSVLVCISGGDDLTLAEVGAVMDGFSARLRRDCHVAVGTVIDSACSGTLGILVLASEKWIPEPLPDLTTSVKPVAVPNSGNVGGRKIPQQEIQPIPSDSPVIRPKPPAAGMRRKPARGNRPAAKQFDFLEEPVPRQSRFSNTAPTVLDGEDLDMPTFIRRGIKIKSNKE